MCVAETKVKITNYEGLVTRKVSSIVFLANKFKSTIKVSSKVAAPVSAKNIFCLQSIDLSKDTELYITADGIDARNAVDSIAQLISNF